jgi:hypothetical protein
MTNSQWLMTNLKYASLGVSGVSAPCAPTAIGHWQLVNGHSIRMRAHRIG